MKTNFRPRNNPRSFRNRTELRTFLIVFCVLVLAIGGITVLKGPLMTVAAPAWRGSAAVGNTFKDFFAIFSSKMDLARENTELKEKISSYDNLLLSSRAINASRESLLQSFGRTASSSGIAASILVRPPETAYDVYILDAGSIEGVAIDKLVHLPEGGIIGKITEVSSHTSKAVLLTSGGEKVEAILERNYLPITLTGRGGGNFDFDVPKGVAVAIGDKILSPNLATEMIGIVRDVSSAPTDSFQHVLVESIGSVFSTRIVLISP